MMELCLTHSTQQFGHEFDYSTQSIVSDIQKLLMHHNNILLALRIGSEIDIFIIEIPLANRHA